MAVIFPFTSDFLGFKLPFMECLKASRVWLREGIVLLVKYNPQLSPTYLHYIPIKWNIKYLLYIWWILNNSSRYIPINFPLYPHCTTMFLG
jgi:hypothetical protein